MDERTGLSALRQLGLGEPEARTYAALAELGPSTAERLAQYAGIHRRTVYDAIAQLSSHGLVVESLSDSRRRFATTGLSALLAWVEENKAAAARFISGQEGKKTGETPKPVVRIFSGKAAMKALFWEQLAEGQTIYWYAGAMQGARVIAREFYPMWRAKRVKQKVPVRMVFVDVPGVHEFIRNERFFEARSIPKDRYTDSPWWLFGDKVALVFWREEPLAVVIQDKELARTYRHLFDAAFKDATPRVKNR
ncbi:MAG: helix-turn-helix domain-containing protein [Candidatus Micrarchaeota archaeon]|nr:helix-turn-helix domain-containing protein [Candidatus Micrarchaeota archaeon]